MMDRMGRDLRWSEATLIRGIGLRPGENSQTSLSNLSLDTIKENKETSLMLLTVNPHLVV